MATRGDSGMGTGVFDINIPGRELENEKHE
jgi:hypothetical protein